MFLNGVNIAQVGGKPVDGTEISGTELDGILDTTVYFSALTAVPAPGAVWLLGTGLPGLAGRRLWRRQRGTPLPVAPTT